MSKTIALVLFSVLSTPFVLAQLGRPTSDSELAPGRLDVEACQELSRPTKNSPLTIDPYRIQGIAPQQAQSIAAEVFPSSPLFVFWADHQTTLNQFPIAFPRSMQCFRTGEFEQGQIEILGIPDGDFIVFVITTAKRTVSGVGNSTAHGTDMFGGDVSVNVATPLTSQIVDKSVFGANMHVGNGTVRSSSAWRPVP